MKKNDRNYFFNLGENDFRGYFFILVSEVKRSVLITLDKFFVEELQRNGYEITFLELRQIYSKSRMRNREALEERRKVRNREYTRKYWHEVEKHKRQNQKKGRKSNDWET